MTFASQFYTVTMAKLYAGQGYLKKAAEIYRFLIVQDPHRQDLLDALADLEAQIARQAQPNFRELGLLVKEWIALQREYNRHRRKRQRRGSPHGRESETP